MNSDRFQRKLTAILSADVFGYSCLMGDDEEATVRALKQYKELIFGLIERHNGRLVDSPGDNVLAEFASVVDAVRCGVRIQEDVKVKNEELPPNRKMEFRIGINIGDVIQDGDRIYGDGVNVAARIESLSNPGGICISGLVYTQVKNRLNLDYEFQGKQTVKNIREPVPVYQVKSLPKTSIQQDTDNDPVSILSGKLSIVVLPFINISGDPEQEYFSDGMTEEIINALANVEGLKVISRTSSFFFKGKDIDLRTIGKKLSVDNVIEGSVRKAGSKIRITAQLIKVADDAHLWSESYNRDLDDVFAIQEEISNAIVDRLKIRILGKEKEPIVKTYTNNINAYESFIKGRYFYNSLMEGVLEEALKYYKQALTLDPNYAPAYSAIAEWYWHFPFAGQIASKEDVYTKAKEAINKAIEIDNNLAEAHATLGLIKWVYEWDWMGAEEAFETALDHNPGSSKSHHDYSLFLAYVTGNFDKSIAEARKAVELDPFSHIAHFCLGVSLFASGQFDQAIEKLQYALKMAPKHLFGVVFLVSAYMEKGMLEEALDETEKGLAFSPYYPILLGEMGTIYALREEKDKTRAILDELLERSKKEYVTALSIASLYAALGEMDQTFEYLEKGYEKRDIFFCFINLLMPSHFLRNDPRFNAFLKKMGL